jgi:hypothetical protein
VPPNFTPTPTPGMPTLSLQASKVSIPGDGTPVAPGDTITYALTLDVLNGPTTEDTVLTDTLGTGLAFGAVTDNPGGFILWGTGDAWTFTLPGGAATGTYVVEYSAVVKPDATSATINNSVIISGGGDPNPECTSCSTDHPIDSDSTAIPALSTWGVFLLIALLAGAGVLRLRVG